KPRIALRLKNLEGCIKAYEPEYIALPTPEEFLARIRGEVEGYTRVIGYENIIEIVAKYLKSYHFAKKYGTPPPAQLMIMLLGEPGLGKTYISQALAKALGRGFHMIGMNGKLNASLITGTNIENPGAEPGEILKAISRREDRGCVIVFDEIEKAARECKEAAGIPTDITTNKNYQDTFLDFPTPTNECIFIATVNRPQDVPGFVADRFAIRVEVLPLSYEQRLEVVRVVLQSELKKLEPAFEKIYQKKWEEIYSLFDQEELLKKTLTWTFSIRGAKNNVLLKLIPTLTSDFLEPEWELPNEYDIQNIYPLLNNLGGDKTLAFRCDRLLKNKIIGESSSLFNDLLICELEYRQMLKFKDLLGELADNLNNQTTLDNQQQENILADIKKLREGKINQAIYIFKEQIENLFLLGSENITDGKPFFQLGAIKEDSERGLAVATQNRKGFSLNNPYLGVVNFHQKYFRFYRDYPSIIHSLGGLSSNNHPVYHQRNLGELETRVKNQQIKGEEMFWLLEIRKKQRLAEYEAATNDPEENEELED
ncbi:17191_t:CDS:2, partial [Racocetra persica]